MSSSVLNTRDKDGKNKALIVIKATFQYRETVSKQICQVVVSARKKNKKRKRIWWSSLLLGSQGWTLIKRHEVKEEREIGVAGGRASQSETNAKALGKCMLGMFREQKARRLMLLK